MDILLIILFGILSVLYAITITLLTINFKKLKKEIQELKADRNRLDLVDRRVIQLELNHFSKM